LRSAVFARYSGAFGLGHVGWALDCDAQLADCGAIENPCGGPIVQPVDMVIWTDTSIDPVPFVISGRYDVVKYFDLLNANPANAYSQVLTVAAESYTVAERNCLDDVYDVLTAYGVSGLPAPTHVLIPNVWFDRLEPIAIPIDSFHWRADRSRQEAEALTRLPPREISLRNIKVGPPPWRIEGTPEA
jgi:hypothetical protein